MPKCAVIVFEEYETLDMAGPIEVLAQIPGMEIELYSVYGGLQKSSQNLKTMALPLTNAPMGGILLIPGGRGTRKLAADPIFVSSIGAYAERADYVLTVCTGSALLAATGLLDGKKATSNKKAFEWARSVRPEVDWQRSARWCVDGKYYTSSGVSAGMDMALGFASDLAGEGTALKIAENIEYIWNSDKDSDPFAV
jgi:putative intracellular protease/amidase